MRKPKTTFSVRSLIVALTLAVIATFYFTFERSASLILPPMDNGRLDESRMRALESDSILRRVISKTEPRMLPRRLRGDEPDYAWLRQALIVKPNLETNEICVAISTNEATTAQLELLIGKLSQFRIEIQMGKPPSQIEWIADWVSRTKQDASDQILNGIWKAGDEILGGLDGHSTPK